jgi:hypothetical protein
MLYASINGMIQVYQLRKNAGKSDLFPEVDVPIDHVVHDFIRILTDGLHPEILTVSQPMVESSVI